MTYKLIDPEEAIHPLREKMTDDDWDRLDRIIVSKEEEDCTLEELAAFTDYLYDRIAARKQTHYGTTVLQ